MNHNDEADLSCLICTDSLAVSGQPVVLLCCGTTACRPCLLRVRVTGNRCPSCRAALPASDLRVNAPLATALRLLHRPATAAGGAVVGPELAAELMRDAQSRALLRSEQDKVAQLQAEAFDAEERIDNLIDHLQRLRAVELAQRGKLAAAEEQVRTLLKTVEQKQQLAVLLAELEGVIHSMRTADLAQKREKAELEEKVRVLRAAKLSQTKKQAELEEIVRVLRTAELSQTKKQAELEEMVRVLTLLAPQWTV